MKTVTMIAATLIATASVGTLAQAQQTQPMSTGQQKAMRYQADQREKVQDEQRMQGRVSTNSTTYGAPDRQSFGRADPESATETAAPKNLVIPGSGTAIYAYDAGNKAWAYGY